MSTLQKIMEIPEVCHEGFLLLECLDCKTWKYMPDISYYNLKAKKRKLVSMTFLITFVNKSLFWTLVSLLPKKKKRPHAILILQKPFLMATVTERENQKLSCSIGCMSCPRQAPGRLGLVEVTIFSETGR